MTTCRLCDGPTSLLFRGVVLRTHSIAYLRCETCGSLQTEEPYWLSEAYSDGNLADTDTGVVNRNLDCQALIYAASRILGIRHDASVLDIGGGSGLLCRLLRDVGFDARVSDAYAPNQFAKGFDDIGSQPDIACAFEVAEHFANPKTDMTKILGRGAPVCIVGTETFRDQSSDWWYLSPGAGQHVFFYSPEGMRILGRAHGYHYERVGNWHFFLDRPLGRVRGALLWRAASARYLKWVRVLVACRSSSEFLERDMKRILDSRPPL